MPDSPLLLTAGATSALQARTDQVARSFRSQDASEEAKIRKSATDFEALLLGQWLEETQKTFASVPGSDPDKEADPGADSFRSIGLQGVATAMANSGGVGIASMLVKYMSSTSAPVAPEKGSASAPEELSPDRGAS